MRGFYWWPIGYTAIGIAVAFYFWGDPISIAAAYLAVLPFRVALAYWTMKTARRRAARFGAQHGINAYDP